MIANAFMSLIQPRYGKRHVIKFSSFNARHTIWRNFIRRVGNISLMHSGHDFVKIAETTRAETTGELAVRFSERAVLHGQILIQLPVQLQRRAFFDF
jgi:hypothetical protein